MSKVALLFPGQGSQYVGMGKNVIHHKIVRETLEEANTVMGLDLEQLWLEGPEEKLSDTRYTQPALHTLNVALFRLYLNELGIEPKLCAGHSLGEITALTCGGAISFSDSIKIVKRRGELMSSPIVSDQGMMYAVKGINDEKIEEICRMITQSEGHVSISSYNALDQIIISGKEKSVTKVVDLLKTQGGKTIKLNVSGPFHCILMKPIVEDFQKELSKYCFSNLQYPVLSNVTGLFYSGPEEISTNLTKQLVEPVQWTKIMDVILKQHIDVAIELGPQAVLTKLLNLHNSEMKVYAYDRESDYVQLFKDPQVSMNHSDVLKLFLTECLRVIVCTPNKNWNEEEYRAGVIIPCRYIHDMLKDAESGVTELSEEHAIKVYEILHTVFETKKTSTFEQRERINEIMKNSNIASLIPKLKDQHGGIK